jgi:hypothetical protein
MDIEAVHAAGLDRNLPILRVDCLMDAVEFNAHDARLYAKIFCLELVKVE